MLAQANPSHQSAAATIALRMGSDLLSSNCNYRGKIKIKYVMQILTKKKVCGNVCDMAANSRELFSAAQGMKWIWMFTLRRWMLSMCQMKEDGDARARNVDDDGVEQGGKVSYDDENLGLSRRALSSLSTLSTRINVARNDIFFLSSSLSTRLYIFVAGAAIVANDKGAEGRNGFEVMGRNLK